MAGVSLRSWDPCWKTCMSTAPSLRDCQQASSNLSLFLPQLSRWLWHQPKQGHLLQRTVLHQLPRAHLDAVLDHRASRIPGLQVHRRLQAAQAQLRLRGAEVYGVRERPTTHHVPGEEGGLHRDRSGWIPKYDCRKMCLHNGQCFYSMKSCRTTATVILWLWWSIIGISYCFVIGVWYI